MSQGIYVRFENPPLAGVKEGEYHRGHFGPFDSLRMSYDTLYGVRGGEETEIAENAGESIPVWQVFNEPSKTWSDIVITYDAPGDF